MQHTPSVHIQLLAGTNHLISIIHQNNLFILRHASFKSHSPTLASLKPPPHTTRIKPDILPPPPYTQRMNLRVYLLILFLASGLASSDAATRQTPA